MEKLALYGAGGHGFAALEVIKSLKQFDPVVFYDDAPKHASILGVDVQATPNEIPFQNVFISIGNNRHRKIIAERYNKSYPSFVHPSVSSYPSLMVGKGSLIMPKAVMDAAVQIGNFCIVNIQATLSHNVVLSDFVHVAINAAICGGVSIGEGSLIGAGSIVLPEVKIGKWSVIGAGAVVTKDVPDYTVVVGNPARILSQEKP